ncbi:helix-turn-helix transcriptional regulator [Asaia sp. HN010]|uniref:helix-turn-helix domain-containing protein n=1 Tax=Asaia sp. HN010 TaxID=3081233 RepID=UPI00301B2170
MDQQLSIGRRLQKLRTEKGAALGHALPQAVVADAVGIARSTLAAYEKGHYLPGRETLTALANYYDVSIDFLSGQAVKVSGTSSTAADEAEWTDLWRNMSEFQRRRALAVLKAVNDADVS